MNDWNSKHYKENALAQTSSAMGIIKTLTFKGNESVLDIGCGDGRVTKAIAEKVPEGEVIGLDPSPNMLKLALKEFTEIPHLKFVKGRAEEFLLEKKFDLITSFSALHWVKDHESVLKNAKASLKPNGKIVFWMVAGGDPRVGEVFDREPWKSTVRCPTEQFMSINDDDYRGWLADAGFVEDKVELRGSEYRYPDKDQLKEHFMTWIPFATGLPHPKCVQFSNEIAENICKYAKTTRDIELIMSMLYVEAHIP